MKKIIRSHEQGVLHVDGKPAELWTPGRHRMPWRGAEVTVVDTRPVTLHVSGQEVLTADGITVKCGASVVYKIVNAVTWFEASDNGFTEQRVHLDVQMGLRDVISQYAAADLLATRKVWSDAFEPISAERAAQYGIEIVEAAVRDLAFPGDLKAKFSQIAVAQQEAQASLERARGEQAALRSLANSAKMLENNPELKTLRTLFALEKSGGQIIIKND